jgi:hypothetical protein
MKSINVYDNFISDRELEEAYQFIHKEYTNTDLNWRFNSTDNCWKKILYVLKTNEPKNFSTNFPCTSVRNFVLKMKNRIEKSTKIEFKLTRVYLNRQNCGEDVPMHIDDGIMPNAYTFLIYLGDITPENFDKVGGILEFKNKEHTKIEPFTKRAILFKSDIPHTPFGPLIPGVTRISLALKLIIKSPFVIRYL